MNILRKNIIYLFLLQGFNYILPLISVPYLVRVLGPEKFGEIAFSQAFVQYLVIATNYSFDLSATRTVALTRADPHELSRLFSSVTIIKISFMIIGLLIVALLISIFPVFNKNWPLYLIAYLTVVGNALFPVWLYQGLECMSQITAITIIARTSMVLGVFLFVNAESDYILAAAFLSGGTLIAGIFALIYVPKIVKVKICWPGFSRMQRDIVDGWHVFVAMLGGSIYNNSNIFMLGLVASSTTVGYFAAADKLIKAIQGVIQPLSQAVYPHIAALIAKSKDDALIFIGKLLRITGFGMLIISISVFLFSAPLSNVLFGEKFNGSIYLIEVMSVVPFLIGLNTVFGAQFLVQFNLGRLLSISIVVPAMMHIIFLYFIATNWGAAGVAVLMILTEMFVLVIRLIGLRYQHRDMLRHVLFLRRE